MTMMSIIILGILHVFNSCLFQLFFVSDQCVSGQVIILLTHFDTISTAELVLVCWFVVWLSRG